MAFWQWSKTAASNATADPNINWAEGQPPSSVNDSARAMMAALAANRDDTNGSLVTGGTSTAYTVTTNQGVQTPTPVDGQELTITVHATSGAAPTLGADGGTQFPLQTSPGNAPPTGALTAGTPYQVSFHAATPCWLLVNFYTAPLAAGSVTTTALADHAVSNLKFRQSAARSLVGNPTGALADVQDITIGTGLDVNGTTLTACPPNVAKHANLSIIVVTGASGNNTVNVVADSVIVSDFAGHFAQVALNSTGANILNLGSSGAINRLDTGGIGTSQWLYIWALTKAGGAAPGVIASLSSTFAGLTLPTDYTMGALIGTLRTASGLAALFGTWQYDNHVDYVPGLGQTTGFRQVTTGTAGSATVGTYSNFALTDKVPPNAKNYTAVLMLGAMSGASQACAAPSAGFGGINSTTNPPPLQVSTGQTGGAGLNSTNSNSSTGIFPGVGPVYYASDTGSAALLISGYDLNL